jgi:hypothetical protein
VQADVRLHRRLATDPITIGQPRQHVIKVCHGRCLPRATRLAQLRAEGYPVLEADVIRLSPYMRRHLNVHGHYSFQLPEEIAGGRRELRDSDTSDDNEDS